MSASYYEEERLKQLAKDPKNRVLVPVHDLVFEPWPSTRVGDCMRKIEAIAKREDLNEDAKKIRAQCMMDSELISFAQHHNSMYDKLTDPKYFKDEKFIKGIQMLVNFRAQVELGVLESGETADKAVVDAMLKLSRE
jgi:hypothetical protein